MATLKSENGWPESKLDVRQVVDVTEGDTDEKLGTEHDQRGMIRMGKKQELRREFRFFSIWGFAVMLGCSWEYVFMSVAVVVRFCGVYVRTYKTSAAMASCRYPMEALQGACGCSSSLVAAFSSWCSVRALILFLGRDTNRYCKL